MILFLLIIFVAYYYYTNIYKKAVKSKPPVVEKITNVNVTLNNSTATVKSNGKTKKLSRRCPHAGCMVNYNKKSNEFVCPCHQSKFNIDGQVIQGPATDNLASIL